MSEFEDQAGNIRPASSFRGGEKPHRMDGKTNRELRGEESLGRRVEAGEEDNCESCGEVFPEYDLVHSGDGHLLCADCMKKTEQLPFPVFSVTIKIMNAGSLKALASIKFGEMEIRGFKVIETPAGGRYVAPPSREVLRGNTPTYHDQVKFDSKEAQKVFRDIIIAEYKKAREADGNTI